MSKDEIDIDIVQKVMDDYFETAVQLERVTEGQSTYVYRVGHNKQIYYLRVLPENVSFAMEAKAHEMLLARGVMVPTPVYFEHTNALLGKSWMLTGEIPGQCISGKDKEGTVEAVLLSAGRQLALINQVKVKGFNWIDRGNLNELAGKNRTFEKYYFDKLYANINLLQKYGFDTGKIKTIMDNAYPALETSESFLVHGDFDSSHIFHMHGRYSGIIDLGEIRGSHHLYDLGHFRLHEGADRFQYLAKGYSDVCKLTPADDEKINYLALFIGLGRAKHEYYRSLIQKQLTVFE